MNHFCPAELKRLYLQGRVLPFVGAGASMSVRWSTENGEITGPSWVQMVNKAASILGYEVPELLRMRGSDLQVLEYFKIKKNNFAPLTNWMVRLMSAPDDAIRTSTVHAALCELTNCGIFYTTNYDDFLERALRLNNRTVQVIATEGDMGFNSRATQVVKFQGDFNNPDEMVVSEQQYYKRMKLESPMDLKHRSDLFDGPFCLLVTAFEISTLRIYFKMLMRCLKSYPTAFPESEHILPFIIRLILRIGYFMLGILR